MIVNLVDGAAGYRLMGCRDGRLPSHRARRGRLLVGLATPRWPAGTLAPGLRQQLRVVATDRQARHLIGTFLLQAIATSMVLAGVVYVANHLIGGSLASTLLFVATIAPALLVSPLWERFGLAAARRSALPRGLGDLRRRDGGALLGPHRSARRPCSRAPAIGIGYAGCQLFPSRCSPTWRPRTHDAVGEPDRAYTGCGRAPNCSGSRSVRPSSPVCSAPSVAMSRAAVATSVSPTRRGGDRPRCVRAACPAGRGEPVGAARLPPRRSAPAGPGGRGDRDVIADPDGGPRKGRPGKGHSRQRVPAGGDPDGTRTRDLPP